MEQFRPLPIHHTAWRRGRRSFGDLKDCTRAHWRSCTSCDRMSRTSKRFPSPDTAPCASSKLHPHTTYRVQCEIVPPLDGSRRSSGPDGTSPPYGDCGILLFLNLKLFPAKPHVARSAVLTSEPVERFLRGEDSDEGPRDGKSRLLSKHSHHFTEEHPMVILLGIMLLDTGVHKMAIVDVLPEQLAAFQHQLRLGKAG